MLSKTIRISSLSSSKGYLMSRCLSSSIIDTDAVVVSFARTPVASSGGSLSSFSAPQLGAKAIEGAMARATEASSLFKKEHVEEVIVGNVVSAGIGQAPGRQAVIYADMPISVPVTDVNKVCASGMKAAMMCAMSIETGYRSVMMAGGMESMSNIPFYMPKNTRSGMRLGHGQVTDGLISDGLWDIYNNQHMGTCGDLCAKTYDISREQQDEYAVNSYKRAASAWEAEGVMQREVIPVEVPGRNKAAPVKVVDTDEEFRNIKYDKVPTLRPAFAKDGSVTAANASKLSDGAAALVMMSGKQVKELGFKTPLFRILGYSDICKDPVEFTTAPADAIPLAIDHANRHRSADNKLSLQDIDYHEVNEAFSVVALANAKILNLNMDRVNVHGGAVALGHPLGCSGLRIIGSLYNVLKTNNKKFGCASICNGGGGASAIIIERLD